MSSLAIVAAAVVLGILLLGVLLRFGARRRTLTRVGFVRALLLATIAVGVLLGIHALAMHFRRPLIIPLREWTTWTDFQIAEYLLLLGELLAWALLCWPLTLLLFWATWRQAFVLWLPAAIGGICLALLVGFGGSYVLEPMHVNYGSMCPTLLNWSQEAECPECGGVAYTPWVTDRRGPDSLWGRLCICAECRHSFHRFQLTSDLTERDEFVVNKLLTPRRWDIVLFRATHLPPPKKGKPLRFVKRVVGLPGEEVVIKEGAVWIDGQRHEPPAEIAGLQYLDRFEGIVPVSWGSSFRSAQLGEDEYFVVGDFSYRSNDSRVWSHRLEGRQPFALPASYIEGVVDVRYAPFHRFLIFR